MCSAAGRVSQSRRVRAMGVDAVGKAEGVNAPKKEGEGGEEKDGGGNDGSRAAVDMCSVAKGDHAESGDEGSTEDVNETPEAEENGVAEAAKGEVGIERRVVREGVGHGWGHAEA